MQATRIDTSVALKEAGSAQTPRTLMSRILVVSEVALALVLLTGAGLLMKSFVRLTSVDPGFKPENILAMSVTLPDHDYGTVNAMNQFHTRALEGLAAVPGVLRAGAINWLPFGGNLLMGDFIVEGLPQLPPDLNVAKPTVSANYFRIMGIPILRGRAFTDANIERSPGVVIVTDQVARRLWPGQDALGKRIKLGFGTPESQPWLSVVGVAGEVKQTGLNQDVAPAIYTPLGQAPRSFLLSSMTFVVRTRSATAAIAPALQHAMQEVDPRMPIDRIETLRNLLDDSVSEPRFRTALVGGFAAIALTLVATGILGVLAYSVTRRTREIGVRMALGASRGDVLRLVLGQALTLSLAGTAIGLVAAAGLTRLLRSFLFDVRPTDPLTFLGASVLLIVVALVASYLPARRATRVDPLIALRAE
jgi:putative ABC transport system permease protein